MLANRQYGLSHILKLSWPATSKQISWGFPRPFPQVFACDLADLSTPQSLLNPDPKMTSWIAFHLQSPFYTGPEGNVLLYLLFISSSSLFCILLLENFIPVILKSSCILHAPLRTIQWSTNVFNTLSGHLSGSITHPCGTPFQNTGGFYPFFPSPHTDPCTKTCEIWDCCGLSGRENKAAILVTQSWITTDESCMSHLSLSLSLSVSSPRTTKKESFWFSTHKRLTPHSRLTPSLWQIQFST